VSEPDAPGEPRRLALDLAHRFLEAAQHLGPGFVKRLWFLVFHPAIIADARP
jgi:hypothetical protein